MIDPVLEDIKQYVYENADIEACGLLSLERGRVRWNPCPNVADNPKHDFIIDPLDYKAVSEKGDVVGVVHSHPGESPQPSVLDRAACDRLGIPWYIFGENDCWALARDFYKEEFNITLPTMKFKDDWWEEGLNYFDDLFDKFGFIEVEEPQRGDIIIFKIYNNIPNHCGVYLEEDIFMHHAENRLSCRESLYPFWIKNIFYLNYTPQLISIISNKNKLKPTQLPAVILF